MTSLVLGDLILESLTPSVNAPVLVSHSGALPEGFFVLGGASEHLTHGSTFGFVSSTCDVGIHEEKNCSYVDQGCGGTLVTLWNRHPPRTHYHLTKPHCTLPQSTCFVGEMSPTRPIFIVHNNPWRGFVVEIEGTFVTIQIPGARILHTRILG
jgi:hypothetical protein